MCMTLYLLGCTGWQQLYGISLVSRNTTREEDSIFLSIIVEKSDQVLDLLYSEGMLWFSLAVAMHPSG